MGWGRVYCKRDQGSGNLWGWQSMRLQLVLWTAPSCCTTGTVWGLQPILNGASPDPPGAHSPEEEITGAWLHGVGRLRSPWKPFHL